MSSSTSRIFDRLGRSVSGVSNTPVVNDEAVSDAPQLVPGAKNDMQEVLKNSLSPFSSLSNDLPR